MVMSTVASVDQGKWASGTEIVYGLAFVAFVSGAVLFHARLATPIALVLGILIGVTATFIIVGQLLPPLDDWGRQFSRMMSEQWTWLVDAEARRAATSGVVTRTTTGTVITLPPKPLWTIPGAIAAFGDGVGDFGARLALWVQQGASGRAVTDNTVFLVGIGLMAWAQGLLGAWGLFRRQDVVVAAVPTGIVLAINATYTGSPGLPNAGGGDTRAPFAIFIITVLLLAVTLNVAGLQRRWRQIGVDFPSGLFFDVTVSSTVVVCGLALLALMGPRLGQNAISNAFWEVAGEQWSDMETVSNRFFAGVNNPQRGTGAGRDRLALAGPARLTQRVVMTIGAERAEYWRGAVYDTWTGKEWLTADRSPVTRTASQPVMAPRFARREKVVADIEIQQSKSDLLYVPDEPAALTVAYRIYGATPESVATDFSALRARRAAIPSLRYAVEAFASRASSEELRTAVTDLPDWVNRYLQVPDLPKRVSDLATTIGRGRRTAYDKAQAVETFLRKYPYTLEVKTAPPDRDAIEYFLFEGKQGYCDYFATAMVVLLRAQGIPARLATGYVTGTYDPESSRYLITEEEAHSWPEVFFPGYGWIPFEPSGYRPPIVRPEVATSSIPPTLQECYEYGYSTFGDCGDVGDASALVGPMVDVLNEAAPGGNFAAVAALALKAVTEFASGVGWVLTWMVVGVVVAVVVWRFAGDYLAQRRAPREAIMHAWWQLSLLGRIAGLGHSPAQTPAEYARGVAIAADDAWSRPAGPFARRLRQLVGEPQADPRAIADAYVRVRYGGVIPSDAERASVEATWRDLRWRLPLVRLLRR
jgi:transglutaminase-like putative cysteine protease